MDVFFRVDTCNERSTAMIGFRSMIFINDIDYCVEGKIFKFADDTQIYRTVISAEDVSALQSGLSNLVKWSKEW